MMSSYYFRQRIPPELRAEIDRANAERAAIIHRALSRFTDGAIVVTEAAIRAGRRLRAAWRRHDDEVRAARELSALDDRTLRDIGIPREGIREAVRGQFRRTDTERTDTERTRNAGPGLAVIHGPGPARIERDGELRECA